MSDKPKFPLAKAERLAEKIVSILKPVTHRIEIAGSIRRKKEMVGDIEILYIPLFTEVPDPQDLFRQKKIAVNAVDIILEQLLTNGSITKRPKSDGTLTWGDENKLAIACKTGIPVDFFSANTRNWFNLLAFRTGGKQSNMDVLMAAKAKGYEWNPYGSGFTRKRASDREQQFVRIDSEEDVFRFVGLPFRKPEDRK